MLHKSNLFLDLISKYFKDHNKVNAMIAYITKSETDLMNRKRIHEMTVGTMSEDLDKAIVIIETANHVVQSVGQIKVEILRKKLELERLLVTEEQTEKARLEFDPSIVGIGNKTEKDKKIREAAKAVSQKTKDEIDEIKIDLIAIEIFVSNSISNKELALSYYQALKNTAPKHG
ncbi:MAG: hypothetical protein ACRCX2_31630 [Paraclostridium sp.]